MPDVNSTRASAPLSVVIVATSAVARIRQLRLEGSASTSVATVSITDLTASWRMKGYALVLVNDGGLAQNDVTASSGACVRIITRAELSCLGLERSRGAAGVLWAIASGADVLLDLDNPWPLDMIAETLPPNNETLLPTHPSVASVAEHFTGLLIERAGNPPQADGSTGAELCVAPVVPVMQLGLCHASATYEWGLHTGRASNWPPASSPTRGTKSRPRLTASGPRLLEDVTPLVLKRGGVSTLEASAAPGLSPVYNRLTGRDAAWALSPARAGSRVSAAIQLALGSVGHALTVMPPGRLCNISDSSTAAVGDHESPWDVPLPAGWVGPQSLGRLESAARRGASGVVAAKEVLAGAAGAVGLGDALTSALHRWLDLAQEAYAIHESLHGGSSAPPSSSREYARHCYRDHPNVRDIVLVLNFNNFPRNGGNASLPNWGPESLERQRALYAPYFPLIVATTDASFVGREGVPSENVLPCWGDYERRFGWPGGIVGEDCAARAVIAFPGRLGYAFVQVCIRVLRLCGCAFRLLTFVLLFRACAW